jgi:hypothetical protein
MGWTWQYLHLDGTELQKLPPSAVTNSFSSQADAESWVGEAYQQLIDDGVDQVTLFEEERKVYGPMSLHPTT